MITFEVSIYKPYRYDPSMGNIEHVYMFNSWNRATALYNMARNAHLVASLRVYGEVPENAIAYNYLDGD